MAFTGFPRQTLDYLAGISADNSKAWFAAHRPLYDATVEASKAFVTAVGPQLRAFAPAVQFEPRIGGSLPRPNTDTRRDKSKPPYKPQLDLWFWHGDKKGWDQPGFYLRIAPDTLWIAAGMMHILWPQLKAFRDAVLDDRAGAALVASIAAVEATGPYQVGYPRRKTVPKGFDAAHPRAEYLKYESLWGHLRLPAEAALEPDFAEVAFNAWRQLSPLAFWLLDEVTAPRV